MVRLEALLSLLQGTQSDYFNSTMVRLEDCIGVWKFKPFYISIPLWYD